MNRVAIIHAYTLLQSFVLLETAAQQLYWMKIRLVSLLLSQLLIGHTLQFIAHSKIGLLF